MSLGLNDDVPIGALAPEPRHKSAGLAFGLSVLIPGLGQFYCGKTARGAMTLGFWLLGLVLSIARVSTAVTGQALIVMLVLWIFSFLDAYFTAIEINQGQDDIVDVQNPRVAVTLNLLTAGFGYFYLGERTKGITIFIGMQVARLLFRATGFWGVLIGLGLFVLQLLVAQDAYRIARRQVKEALGTEAAQPVANAAPSSRLPVQVPVALACVVVAGSVLLVVIGLAVKSARGGKRPAVAVVKVTRPEQSGFDRRSLRNDTPIPVVDFATAVQDVQRVQRKVVRTKDEIPYLKQDVRMLSAELGTRKVDASDAMVARYYRAVALATINAIHERDGDAEDLAGARMARADLDKIIGAGTVLTYVPEISISNSEYWAGIITRNQLHDEKAAYSYWEQCAGMGHAGCMNNVAGAHLTGAGGEKVDIPAALELHAAVYNSGVKYHCAGALSAISIAYINYFTGVRRSGDDELEWTKKSDELLDKLEARENDRNVCGRSDEEVDEFLFQLSRGHRDDTILQDAVSRLDENSNTVKAVIQFISGAIDEAEFDAAVQSEKLKYARCSAYFDAMWYSELHKEDAVARRQYQHLQDLGKFHCGEHLAFASKFKF